MSRHLLIIDNGSRSAGLIGQLARDAGWRTAVTRVAELSPAMAADAADAVILTGTHLPVFASAYEAEIALIRSCSVPILGICGGMQLIGRAFGVGLTQGEPVIGRTVVRLVPDVEMFAGMPREVTLFQRHIYRLDAVPEGFIAIASSLSCAIEGIGRPCRGIYGMQAHLEFRAEGQQILHGFLRSAEAGR